MTDVNEIHRQHIEKLNSILEDEGILLGGAALPFYGIERATEDIDIEVSKLSLDQLNKYENELTKANIQSDITSNASGWGIIPLPTGYQERALQTDLKNIKVLDPLDFIMSKMRRGTQIDFEDCLAVCKAKNIKISDIDKQLKKVELPADPATNLFLKRIKVLKETIKPRKKSRLSIMTKSNSDRER